MNVLITGSSGLIGTAVSNKLKAIGIQPVPFDLKLDSRAGERQDVRNEGQVRAA